MTAKTPTARSFVRIASEFGLIVLGVLVALYAQQLADRAGERALGQEYLLRLGSDVQSDIEAIEGRLEFLAGVQEAGRRTLAWLGSDAPGDESVLLVAMVASEVWLFQPNGSTYRDLQSTGNFALIGDIDLRKELDAYHSSYGVAASGWPLPGEYRRTVRGIVPLSLHTLMIRRCGASEATISANLATRCPWAPTDASDVVSTLREIRNAPEIKSQLRFLMSEAGAGIRQYRGQLSRAKELRTRLDEATARR